MHFYLDLETGEIITGDGLSLQGRALSEVQMQIYRRGGLLEEGR